MLTYATFTFGVAGDGLDGGRKQRGPRMRGTASSGVAAWCYTALRSHTFPIGKGPKSAAAVRARLLVPPRRRPPR